MKFADLPDESIEQEQNQQNSAPEGEISRYYDIGWNPNTWGNIPKELMLQSSLAIEPSSQGQAGIARRQLPEDYKVNYDPVQDATTVTDPSGRTGWINEPGLSVQDAMQTAGLAGMFNPAARAGLAATTPAQAAIRSSTAAGLTEAGRQQLSNIAGSESRGDNLVPGVDFGDIASAAATQFLPDFVTSRSYMGQYGPASWQAPRFMDTMEENVEALSRSGLQALRGQVSEIPAESRDLKVLSQLRHSGPPLRQEFESQNQQAQDAVERILSGGPIADTADSGAALRGRLSEQRDRLVDARKEMEAGQYTIATADPNVYDTTSLVAGIDETINSLATGSKLQNRLSKLRTMLGGTQDGAEPQLISQMHDAKLDIDDQIESAMNSGKKGLARQLMGVKTRLVRHIEDNSEDYAQARSIWEKMSRPINEFDESIAGVILGLDERQSYKLGEYVFNPSRPNSVRRELSQKLGDGGATLEQLARDTMRAKLGKIADISTSDAPANVPYKILNALFRNKQQRDMWKDALPDQADDLDALIRGLEIQGRNRSIGSDTAFNQEARDRFGGSSINSGTDLIKEIMEWITVVPKAAKYTLGTLNDATARRRQEAGVLAQQDLGLSQYMEPPRFRKQSYPNVTSLIQAGQMQASNSEIPEYLRTK